MAANDGFELPGQLSKEAIIDNLFIKYAFSSHLKPFFW
jgi:hypothetical protein